jgi:hypothetical protein
MTPVFVDGAAGLALAAPELEVGLVLHLRTLSHNVLRDKAQRRCLGRARSDDLPSASTSPSGSNPRPPSDLHAQVLSGDLTSPLEHCVFSSPVAWPSHTHTRPSGHSRSPGPFFYATTRLTSHRELTLDSGLNFSPLLCPSIPISPGNNRRSILLAPYYFIIHGISVDTTAP